MKQMKAWRMNCAKSAIRFVAGSRIRAIAFAVVVLMISAIVTAAVRGYSQSQLKAIPKMSTTVRMTEVQTTPGINNLRERLAFQPEADRLRRRLGERFTKPGRERTTLAAVLTIAGQQYHARIVRTQDDFGEQVEIQLNGVGGSLTWNSLDGPKSAGRSPATNERP